MMAMHADHMSGDERKRKLCLELALVLKAEAIIDGFLADTKHLDLPPEWTDAVTITKSKGEAQKVQLSIKKVLQSTDYRELVVYAKRDAETLSLKEITEGMKAEGRDRTTSTLSKESSEV